jgi:hypothetical protein
MDANFEEANSSFFEEFMKCISTEDTKTDEEKTCMITYEPLKKYAVQLKCGHSFNYEPLLHATYQYKVDQKNNGIKVGLSTPCPYCREKTDGLLPCIPISEKIHGVNMPHKHSFGENKCVHVMMNKKQCDRECYFDKCHLHLETHGPADRLCKGVTKAGNPCKYKASSGNSYCKLHQK